jgi:hypothetical protein
MVCFTVVADPILVYHNTALWVLSHRMAHVSFEMVGVVPESVLSVIGA